MAFTVTTAKSESVKILHIFNWIIEDFRDTCAEGSQEFDRIDGPLFMMQHPDGSKSWWQLLLFGEYGVMRGCWIRRRTEPPNLHGDENTALSWHLNIWLGYSMVPAMHRVNEVEVRRKFKDQYWGWADVISLAELYDRRHELLESGKLQIRISMTVLQGLTTTVTSSSYTPCLKRSIGSQAALSHAESDEILESLLEKETEFFDVKFDCGSEEIKAHKCILANRSEVFYKMFTTAMDEAASGIVHVDDLEPSTFRFILRYIYTGKVTELEPEDMLSVIHGAEKYGLDELKNYCFGALVECITDENAGALAVAAYLYRAQPRIVKTIRHYLSQDFFKKVQKNKELRQLVKQYGDAFFG